jgi:hypothetical protein
MNRLLGGLALGSLALSACATTKQYTLKIDGKAPSETQLCTVTSDAKEGECKKYTNEALESPAALGVVVQNPEDTGSYRLRVQQTVVGGPEQDPAAIVAAVLERFEGFSKAYAGTNKVPGEPDVKGDEKLKGALSKILDQVGTARGQQVVAAVQDRIDKIVGKPPAVKRQSAADLEWTYKSYLAQDPTQTPHLTAPDKPELVILNQPAIPYPPPRLFELDRQDVDELAKLTVKDPELGIATLVLEACKLESFGVEPYDDAKTPLLDYFKKSRPSKEALIGFLDIHATSLDDLLRTAKSAGRASLLERVKALRNAGNAKVAARLRGDKAEAMKPEEELVVSLYDANRAHHDVARCLANASFVAKLAAAKSGDAELGKVAKLMAAEVPKLTALRDATAPFEDVFYGVIDSVTERVVIALQDGLRNGDNVQFGTVSLQPGSLQVTVTHENSGEDAKQIADYAIEVERNPLFAISIGPALSVCSKCFRHVTEEVVSDPVGGKRLLVLQTESIDYTNAILLHVGLVRRGWFAGGITLGYPVSDTSERAKAAMVGISARHRIGVALSAGAMVFWGQRLKDAYASSGTIDTSEPGLSSLTTDSVVDTGPEMAFFVNLGVTSDLFQRLK